ncbi:ribosome biogenesis protein SLX9 homolog isoform X4 [Sagmatias obliquidens]|uniref:ribosome biogenesis protein SLX9 homolog isoform X4 n=1 Tax=Sagmatias obliquidens TaxID=3371155 RepID=UPI000F4464F6|nr:protein FAM207A isoform X4 [Lagenorhynchus obliquidens]
MGKVRGLRSRVHKAAVRPTGEAAPGPTPPAREAASLQASAGGVGGKEWVFMNASVFAGTTIDPSALVQKLDVDARSSASVRRGAKAKAVLPKKEKLKLRRERWLQMAGTFAVLLEGVRIGPSLHGLRTGPWSVSREPALLRVSNPRPGQCIKVVVPTRALLRALFIRNFPSVSYRSANVGQEARRK